MKCSRHILALAASIAAISSHAESFRVQRPKMQPPYANISFVVEGPVIALGQRVVRGKFHRLTVIDSGIVYEAPILRFDTLTYGDEGCCRRVITSFELPLSDVLDKLNPATRPEETQFKFLHWDGPTSLQFTYGEAKYIVQGVGTSAVSIEAAR